MGREIPTYNSRRVHGGSVISTGMKGLQKAGQGVLTLTLKGSCMLTSG